MRDRWLLSAIVESSDDAIVSKDLEGTITTWNKAAKRIFGYTATEIVGQPITRLLPPDRFHEETAFLDQLKRGERIHAFETLRVRKDGSLVPVSLTISPLRNGAGRIIGASKIARDITDRKRAEQALRESEEQHRTITETMPHLIWRTAADGALEYVNGKWTDYTGLSLAQSAGEGWNQALHPEDAPRVSALWQQALIAHTVYNCDYRLRSKEGHYRWFKSWGVPLLNDRGTVVNWFGTCTDIDDVVKAREVLARDRDLLEKTVQEQSAKLQEMVAELETFSYSIAHDMRGPLRAMQGFADAVLEDYGERVGPEGKDHLQRIKAAAARQDHFIRDVLNYSRVVRQELKLEPVNLEQLVASVVMEYPNLQAAREHLEITRPLGVVRGHGPCLVQCVSNLLGNALKFVPQGTIPHVKIWSERRSESVRLWIEDNGVGIAQEHHERIFRLFERLHGQSEYSGTGIGLAVVRKAMERMGGSVGVESVLGKGSRFWIELQSATSPPGPGENTG
jgi:PAS domain S-box-containing protein